MNPGRDGGRGTGHGAQELEAFADRLAGLRATAGSPSYRAMAKASGCISHATLHEAAHGARFPSWETVEQFVAVCGGDREAWRRDWEVTNRAVHGDGGASPAAPDRPAATGAAAAPGTVDPEDDAAPTDMPADPVPRPRRLPALLGIVAAAVVVVLVAALIGIDLVHSRDEASTASPGADVASAGSDSGADAQPLDASDFVADVTVPDGEQIPAGSTITKTWRLRNAGEVDWTDRYLVRSEASAGEPCGTDDRVLVPDTHAGDTVDVSVEVTLPDEPAHCRVEWKMVDGDGTESLPGSRPLYFELEAI